MNEQRPDTLLGRKLPEHALWEQLQRRAQPLALEFCSQFFNGEMSYKAAQKWLAGYGLKVSVTALSGFFNSLPMRTRYASLVAAQQADTAKAELPANIEEATRERIAQTMFEMAHLNLGESQRLQLIALQLNKDGMKGNYELKNKALALKRIEVMMKSDEFISRMMNKAAELLGNNQCSQADRIKLMRQEMFKDVDEFWAKENIQLPGQDTAKETTNIQHPTSNIQ